MKFNNLKITAIAVLVAFTAFNCSNDDDNGVMATDPPMENPGPDFSGTYAQRDQMARPAVNTVFISSGSKDAFNTTAPSQQAAMFKAMIRANLEGVSPAFNSPTDTNLLGLNSDQFAGVLATDVLTVSLTEPTTFYNGTQVLTGRTLTDDVIDVELILIFGGPMGADNPGLTNDGVPANDKEFLAEFPYLAAPFL